jgi:tRNA dimethylallyltransferase
MKLQTRPANAKATAGRQKLVVILGPTSSGKTNLAQKLCKKFNGFIISADSRQVYRYMDIGTGKVDTIDELVDLKRQRQRLLKKDAQPPLEYVIKLNDVSHYMIDVVEPSFDYNVALYKQDVYGLLDKILDIRYSILASQYPISNIPARLASQSEAGRQYPFLVGGTGLYIDAVVDNWQFPPGEPNLELRQKIESNIKAKGLDTVWQKLVKLDPGCENFVQKENPRRIARALEYILSTGQKFSKNRSKSKRLFKVLKIGIKLSRDELYKKIDKRVDSRIKIGMVEEVEELMLKHKVNYKRLQQFGLEYRVIADYLVGKFDSVESMSQRLKWDIHAYARRQLTWFRRDKEINWVSNYKEAKALVQKFLQ